MSDDTVVFEKEYGTEYSKIWADFKETGELYITGVDGGAKMEGMLGADDYEYGMTIKKVDFDTFAKILSEKGGPISPPYQENFFSALRAYFTRGGKFGDLEAACKERGMSIASWNWY